MFAVVSFLRFAGLARFPTLHRRPPSVCFSKRLLPAFSTRITKTLALTYRIVLKVGLAGAVEIRAFESEPEHHCKILFMSDKTYVLYYASLCMVMNISIVVSSPLKTSLFPSVKTREKKRGLYS